MLSGFAFPNLGSSNNVHFSRSREGAIDRLRKLYQLSYWCNGLVHYGCPGANKDNGDPGLIRQAANVDNLGSLGGNPSGPNSKIKGVFKCLVPSLL